MNSRAVAFVLFLLVLIFYTVTLQPSLAWGDGIRLQREVISAESFILAEMVDVPFAPDPFPFARLGVAAWDHPLYVITGHLLLQLLPQLLPQSLDPLWLVNFVSALFAAGSVALLFLWCQRHTRSTAVSAFAALALALSHTFWWHAVTPEVYTLFTFLLLLSVLLYEAYEETARRRYLYATAFTLGLGAANHLLAMLAVGALAVYWLINGLVNWNSATRRNTERTEDHGEDFGVRSRHFSASDASGVEAPTTNYSRSSAAHLRQKINLQSLMLIGLAFLLGFSLWWIQFLRLLRTFPLAEVMGPAVGDTFLRGSLALTPGLLMQSVVSYLTFLVYQFGPHGLALGLYGWWKGRSVAPQLWAAALALYLVYLLFGLVYRVSDQFAFFLGAHLFWAVALALGLARLVAVLKPRARQALAAGLGLTLLLTPVFYGVAPTLLRDAGVTEESFGIPQIGTGVRDGLDYYLNPNKRGDTQAYQFGQQTLQQLPPDALVLAEWYVDTDEYFVFRYFAAIEGLRPDVEVLGWPTVDPFAFDPALAVQIVEHELPHRPVYLASLSDHFYDATVLIQRYCITPQHNLYRIHPPDSSPNQPCLTPNKKARALSNSRLNL